MKRSEQLDSGGAESGAAYFRDSSCEIARYGSLSVIHSFRDDSYHQIPTERLPAIAWEPYTSPLHPHISRLLFLVFFALVVLEFSWMATVDVRDVPVPNVAALSLFLALNVALHELSHVAALRLFNRRPDKVGFKFNYRVLPAFYVRMNQVLLLERREQLVCHGAGLFVNLFTVGMFLMLGLSGIWPGSVLGLAYVFLAMLLPNVLPVLNSDGQKILLAAIGSQQARRWSDMTPPAKALRVFSVIALVLIVARAFGVLLYWTRIL